MKPSQVAEALNVIASRIDNSENPNFSLVASDINAIIANLTLAKKKPKYQQRGKTVFPHTSPKVKDNKDHFPINDADQARNALSRANQYSKVPSWYDGSLEELVNAVARKVHSEYPSIEVSEESKKPGKGKGKKSSLNPDEMATKLRKIAAAIDASNNPKLDLVIKNIKALL